MKKFPIQIPYNDFCKYSYAIVTVMTWIFNITSKPVANWYLIVIKEPTPFNSYIYSIFFLLFALLQDVIKEFIKFTLNWLNGMQ